MPPDADLSLSLVHSGAALMRECSVHRATIKVAVRTLESGQPLTNRENIEILEGMAALCARIQGDTQLRMFAAERIRTAVPVPAPVPPLPWIVRVWVAAFG